MAEVKVFGWGSCLIEVKVFGWGCLVFKARRRRPPC